MKILKLTPTPGNRIRDPMIASSPLLYEPCSMTVMLNVSGNTIDLYQPAYTMQAGIGQIVLLRVNSMHVIQELAVYNIIIPFKMNVFRGGIGKSACLSVSVCVQNTSFCQSARGDIKSNLVTALVQMVTMLIGFYESIILRWLPLYIESQRCISSLPFNPDFYDPRYEAFWKHFEKRRKCCWATFSPFPIMFSTHSKNNFCS